MHILIVDDSKVSRAFFTNLLHEAGYRHLILADSVADAFEKIHADRSTSTCTLVDLILMDVNMPGKNGIQGCRELKSLENFQDVPVIIVSGEDDQASLQDAFDAGALDYITKPPNRVELLARVRAALRLKTEMDRRKSRELELLALTQQLEEANRELHRLSTQDGLTGVANRHSFNAFFDREWRRALREEKPIAVIMVDIDFFKAFNDTNGHLAGDKCLQRVAAALQGAVRRPADLLARYGGEEFVVVLPAIESEGAETVAAEMHAAVAALRIDHAQSAVSDRVTVSMGIASTVPARDTDSGRLLAAADQALYQAKQAGRNRTCLFCGEV
jgi:diguanylate cyclase (GGDEF)-like protein